jgi:exosome complex component CSL4
MSLPSIALPGQVLGPSTKYLPGPGTHIHGSQIYASVAGAVTSQATPNAESPPLLSISRSATSTSSSSLLPEVSSTVLARVTRLGQRFASLEILVIGSSVCNNAFPAQIRREDIRATEKDKVKIEESFRVGDIVRAEVISLGDQSNYYLSTARNELGVVLAWAEEGRRLLQLVSWREVRDPVSGRRESRKVAKPFA